MVIHFRGAELHEMCLEASRKHRKLEELYLRCQHPLSPSEEEEAERLSLDAQRAREATFEFNRKWFCK